MQNATKPEGKNDVRQAEETGQKFVGRQREMARREAAMDAASAGDGPVVMLARVGLGVPRLC